MEFLLFTRNLEGKTIRVANLLDCGNYLSIAFTDDTCAFFKVSVDAQYTYDIHLSHKAEDYLQRDAGIISIEEYEIRKAKTDKAYQESLEKDERAKLAKLKLKYDK